jgi:hypothetical protein
VDVVVSFPADPQSVAAVQPGDGALDHPTEDAQAGAVLPASFGDHRGNASRPDEAPVLVVVVAPVSEQGIRAPTGPANDTDDRRGLVEQGQQLGTSLRLPPVSDTASGMPWPSVRTWCLLPGRARSTGLGSLLGLCGPPGRERSRSPPATSRASSLPAASPAAPGAVRRDAGLVPGGQAPPARHPRAEAQLLWQVLPLDAGVQYEQDPAQGLAVREPRPALNQLRPRLRQQRLDQRPQFVRDDPRSRLPLSHDQTNEQPSPPSHDQRLLSGPLTCAFHLLSCPDLERKHESAL